MNSVTIATMLMNTYMHECCDTTRYVNIARSPSVSTADMLGIDVVTLKLVIATTVMRIDNVCIAVLINLC